MRKGFNYNYLQRRVAFPVLADRFFSVSQIQKFRKQRKIIYDKGRMFLLKQIRISGSLVLKKLDNVFCCIHSNFLFT